MKYFLILILVTSAIFAGTILDESSAGLSLSGSWQINYVSGANPDDGSTVNAILLGKNATASASINVIEGNSYRIRVRRKISSSVNISYNLSINGSVVYTDWCMVPQGSSAGFEEVFVPGYWKAASSVLAVKLTGAGSGYSCIDYMIFEQTDDFYFDERSTGMEYAGVYGFMNIPYTMPKTGNNAISFQSSGTAAASVFLAPGVYDIYANRTVNSNGNVGYSIEAGGYYFRDEAHTEKYFNDFAEEGYVGTVNIADMMTEIKVYDGGTSYARLDYLRFQKVGDRYPDVYFNEDCSRVKFSGDAGVAFASDAYVLRISPNASAEGVVKLIPGRAYNVYARRIVNNSGSMAYNITLSNDNPVRDNAIALVSNDGMEEALICGFVPDALFTNIKLDGAGTMASQVDHIRFEELSYPVFDESLLGLNLTGNAAITYDAAATPDDGQTGNAVFFSGSGTVAGVLNVLPGERYKVFCRRKVHPAGQISFGLNIDSAGYVTDPAMDGDLTDVYAEIRYPGYYFSDDSAAYIELSNGGEWTARFDYLYLKPDIDTYFDENVSGLILSGGSYYATVEGSFPAHTGNALGLSGVADEISGIVKLTAGQLYNVYSRRSLSIYDFSDYDIFFGDDFFYHDFAVTSDSNLDGVCRETFLKQYTPDSDSVLVTLQYCGVNGAVVDYIRFEPVFDRYCGQTDATLLEGDLNGDCAVDIADYVIFLSQWLNCYDPDDETCLD